MQKFLKVTNASTTGQLISIEGVKAVTTASADAETVVISYNDGTATTVKTAAQVDSDVYEAIVEGMKNALITAWYNPYYELELPKAVDSIVNAVSLAIPAPTLP